MASDNLPLPPVPYARVELATPHNYTYPDYRYVPLTWLQDWQMALKLPVQHSVTFYGIKIDAASEPIFTCFYDAANFATAPHFHGALQQLHDWNDTTTGSRTAALCKVRVLSLYLSETEPFAHVPHAKVLLKADKRLEFTVPLVWIGKGAELHRPIAGRVVNESTVHTCFFDPRGMRKNPTEHCQIDVHDFFARERRWHEVHVLQVFEGELQKRKKWFVFTVFTSFTGILLRDSVGDCMDQERFTFSYENIMKKHLAGVARELHFTRGNLLSRCFYVLYSSEFVSFKFEFLIFLYEIDLNVFRVFYTV